MPIIIYIICKCKFQSIINNKRYLMPGDIIFHIIATLISSGALILSIFSMRQAKDTKNAEEISKKFAKTDEQIDQIIERMAFHEKEDAAAFSTIKARLHSHRALLRFLQTLPERTRVLEYIAKIKADAKTNEIFDRDAETEDDL